MTEHINDILNFWFGDLNDDGMPVEDRQMLWFQKSDETDQKIRDQFLILVEQALAGDLNHWADDNDGLMALVILLDQFTRNLFRGDKKAFDGDENARQLVKDAIVNHRHKQMPPIYQVFLFLPLEHSEDLEDQRHCVALFEELYKQNPTDMMKNFLQYAQAHFDVIEQFGRFPHRNDVLGRTSTVQEIAHLNEHGGF